jgi:hypothetical protein
VANREVELQFLGQARDPGFVAITKSAGGRPVNLRQRRIFQRTVDLLGPFALVNLRLGQKRLIRPEPINQFIQVAKCVIATVRPRILAISLHRPAQQRIGFDVPQHREQVLIVLDHGAVEPTSPQVAAGAVVHLIPLRVQVQQAPREPADVGLRRPHEQMEECVQQSATVEVEWRSRIEIGQRLKNSPEVFRIVKHILPIVATIDHVVDQSVLDRSQRAGHGV